MILVSSIVNSSLSLLSLNPGAITNINNEDLCYGRSNFKQDGFIIASNNHNLHEEVCAQIKEIITRDDLYLEFF